MQKTVANKWTSTAVSGAKPRNHLREVKRRHCKANRNWWEEPASRSSGTPSRWGTHSGQGSPRKAALPSAQLGGAREHRPMQPKPVAEGPQGTRHQHLSARQLLGLSQGPCQRVTTRGSRVRPQDGDFPPPPAPSTHHELQVPWGVGRAPRWRMNKCEKAPPKPARGPGTSCWEPQTSVTTHLGTPRSVPGPPTLPSGLQDSLYPSQKELPTCSPQSIDPGLRADQAPLCRPSPGCFSGPRGLVVLDSFTRK